MNIRKKTAIIIGLTLVCLILVLLVLSEVIVIGEFNQLETRSAENDMYRVMTAISYDLLQMDTMVHEWTSNPTVQEYFTNPSGSSSGTLLENETFERLQYNTILFFDASGNLVDGKMYDLATHREIPLPESLLAYFTPENRFFEHADALRLTGVVQLADGPMFISMRPVHANGGNGQVVGSILIGRYFDQHVLTQISMLTNSSLGMFENTNPNMPDDVISSIPRIPKGLPFFIMAVGEDGFEFNAPMYTRPVNDTSIATYARINDVFESPIIILRMTVPREIYAQGRTTTGSFVLLLFIACLSFGIAILLLLETTVLSRISRMSKEVGDVGSAGVPTTRVSGVGGDEIGHLATSINWMLAELESVHAQLKSRLIQTEDRFQVLFNSSNDIVFIESLYESGAPDAIIEVNDAGYARLGYTRSEFLAIRPELIVAVDQIPAFTRFALECHKTGYGKLTTKFVTKTGETVPVEIFAQSVRQQGHPAILLICHDITERLRVEQERIRMNDELCAANEELLATEDELRHNFEELQRSQQTLTLARKKLSLLNTVTFQDIQNAVFSLSGYLELECDLKSSTPGKWFTQEEMGAIQKISAILNFAKNYEDLGISPPRWHNVHQTFLYAISHLDLSKITRKETLNGLEIYTDPLLEKVFLNLASNVLVHSTSATEISLYYEEIPDGLRLIFTDNGPGIPDSEKEKIFQKGYGKKKGMGLFLASEILSITGLTIHETGEPGKGARFVITVPREAYRFDPGSR